MFVPDLDGPGVEAAETPFDINDRVTVLQELQQFREDNSSKSAASTGIKDVPVTPTGWIPRVGDLVREKVAVKKEFGPFYRPPVPVLGIHGTRTLFYHRCQVAKKIALFLLTTSSYNMWPILHSRPRGTSSSSRIPLTTGEDVPLQVIYTNTVASPSLGRVDDDLALVPLTTNNLETFDRVTMTTYVMDGALYSVPPRETPTPPLNTATPFARTASGCFSNNNDSLSDLFASSTTDLCGPRKLMYWLKDTYFVFPWNYLWLLLTMLAFFLWIGFVITFFLLIHDHFLPER
ncbi:hypothetical protein NDU88_002917 [Pleurodeles waltl]|uniref:Uncharacterized protein n=1 Tax=Pleurodeles waltl TaxID=8319 RepID=A0AAV7QB86_PLEWA|nr:hypothetical protein NDU88_002917 [Pleurodeles waltl]